MEINKFFTLCLFGTNTKQMTRNFIIAQTMCMFLSIFSGCTPQAEKIKIHALGKSSETDTCILINPEIEEAKYITNNCITIPLPDKCPRSNNRDIIEDYNFIPLETSEECLISRIHKIIIDENSLFIFDEQGNAAYRFSTSGKYLNKFGNKGRGPGEYEKICDMTLNEKEKEVCLLDNHTFKMLFYDYNGILLREEPMFYSFHNIEYIDGKFILCPQGNITPGIPDLGFYNVMVATEKQIPIQRAFFYETGPDFSFRTASLHKGLGKIYSQNILSDTIWQLKDNTWEASYCIKSESFVPPTRPEIKKWTSDDVIKLVGKNITRYAHHIAETNEFICFGINHNGIGSTLIYNKKNGHVHCEHYIGVDYVNNLGQNLYYGTIDFAFDEEKFVNVIQPTSITYQKEYFENRNISFSPKDKALVDKVTEEDNPVLMVFSLKHF